MIEEEAMRLQVTPSRRRQTLRRTVAAGSWSRLCLGSVRCSYRLCIVEVVLSKRRQAMSRVIECVCE
eukprot:3213374-Rhodomonas_salina.1